MNSNQHTCQTVPLSAILDFNWEDYFPVLAEEEARVSEFSSKERKCLERSLEDLGIYPSRAFRNTEVPVPSHVLDLFSTEDSLDRFWLDDDENIEEPYEEPRAEERFDFDEIYAKYENVDFDDYHLGVEIDGIIFPIEHFNHDEKNHFIDIAEDHEDIQLPFIQANRFSRSESLFDKRVRFHVKTRRPKSNNELSDWEKEYRKEDEILWDCKYASHCSHGAHGRKPRKDWTRNSVRDQLAFAREVNHWYEDDGRDKWLEIELYLEDRYYFGEDETERHERLVKEAQMEYNSVCQSYPSLRRAA